jgi:H+/Cl- antiporter ClcA
MAAETPRTAPLTEVPAVPTGPPMGARPLLMLVIPGIAVGIVTAVMLLLVSEVAALLSDVLWGTIPGAVGISGESPLWIFLMLLGTGIAVGLVVAFAPGHAGPDPATIELAAPPLPLVTLPGLTIALVLMLAGGVSLGPENPIIAVNTGLVVAVGMRLFSRLPVAAWAGLSFAGTLGAMFGTPVAAALALSEVATKDPRPLWDRIFGPLVAAAAGAITMNILGGESFALPVDPYGRPAPVDLLTAPVIGILSAAGAMVAIYAFPIVHRGFARLRSPFVALVVGGALLGVLGAIGGQITLFKGLEQMTELVQDVESYSTAQLGLFFLIKLVAVVIAGTCGFRGGRIFPSVFASVALGLCIHSLLPAIPMAVALTGAMIGVLVAVTRNGWLSLFLAGVMVGDLELLPLMLIVVLASWLVVTGRPEMVVPKAQAIPQGRDSAPVAPAA